MSNEGGKPEFQFLVKSFQDAVCMSLVRLPCAVCGFRVRFVYTDCLNNDENDDDDTLLILSQLILILNKHSNHNQQNQRTVFQRHSSK